MHVLLFLNLYAAPSFGSPTRLAATLGTLAPFVLVGMASTPSVLSGGIDVSVVSLMTFVNCFFVAVLVPAGLGNVALSLPIVLLLGLAAGTLNGVLIAIVRLHPVVATTGTLFLFSWAARS